jgi:hypothetical protein
MCCEGIKNLCLFYQFFGILLNRKIFKYQFFGIIMDLESYFKKELITRIIETELERYVNFFENSYIENLEHCKFNIEKFPRWSIISGYYAMHDITKLFLAKKFSIKVEFKVHETVIKILGEILKDKETLRLLEIGYEEFIKIANDLVIAKKKRIKVQYYTGSEFMKEKYKVESKDFLYKVVIPYLDKIKEILR